jgi:hypothetical protein
MGGTSMAGGKGSALGTMFGVLALGIITNLLNVANVNMICSRWCRDNSFRICADTRNNKLFLRARRKAAGNGKAPVTPLP